MNPFRSFQRNDDHHVPEMEYMKRKIQSTPDFTPGLGRRKQFKHHSRDSGISTRYSRRKIHSGFGKRSGMKLVNVRKSHFKTGVNYHRRSTQRRSIRGGGIMRIKKKKKKMLMRLTSASSLGGSRPKSKYSNSINTF